MKLKEYIGNSVYAEVVDGFLILTTQNGLRPSNQIMIDRNTLNSLRLYLETYSGLVDA